MMGSWDCHVVTSGEGARPCPARAEKVGGPTGPGCAGSGGCRRRPLHVALFVQCALPSILIYTSRLPLYLSMHLVFDIGSHMNKIAALSVQCASPLTAFHTSTRLPSVEQFAVDARGASHLVPIWILQDQKAPGRSRLWLPSYPYGADLVEHPSDTPINPYIVCRAS